jgi:Negative regulator of sigma E activity
MRKEELDELSAVIDNEAGHQVMVQVSRRISQDEQLRKTLVRYQMIGDCLRGEEIDPRSADLVMAVSRRLEQEPTVLAPVTASRRSRWLQPVAGAAIAASVAAAGVMLGPRFINPQGGVGEDRNEFRVVAQPAPATIPVPALVAHDRLHWKTVEAPHEHRLDRYLEQHSRYATQNGLQRMIPYTTLVSYGGIPRVEGE